jgi:hypothetical protein
VRKALTCQGMTKESELENSPQLGKAMFIGLEKIQSLTLLSQQKETTIFDFYYPLERHSLNKEDVIHVLPF